MVNKVNTAFKTFIIATLFLEMIFTFVYDCLDKFGQSFSGNACAGVLVQRR
jgi:hypothetical protein